MHSEILRLYRKIFSYFVKDGFISIKNFNKINLSNCLHVKAALTTTNKLSVEASMDSRNNCLKFLDNVFLQYVEILGPDNVISGKVKTISQLIRFFPRDDEWRILCHFNFKEHNLTEEKSTEIF